MGFQIYQREKSQAIDLLDRVVSRILDERSAHSDAFGNPTDDDYDFILQESQNALTRLTNDIEAKHTNLNREVPVDLATLAQLLRNFDDQKRGSAAEWFATYFSNYNVDRDEFLLAAGYALPERDQLLRVDHYQIASDYVDSLPANEVL